ncbi:MAG: hypothetical protein B7Z49_04175 [Hydrogenophilales bacterium 12-63-5]|nr:MAG: hypothetical protein B7Z49_04175 [Hydrogenophilales bacterium 12-63-5]
MVTREIAIFQTILCVITQSLPDDRRDPATCHMGDVVNYDLIKVARTKPSGTDWAFDFMSDVRDMQRAAKRFR